MLTRETTIKDQSHIYYYFQNVREQLVALERICQTKEHLIQAKEAETGRLTKLVELKQKMITEIQLSNKVRYWYI